MGARGITPKGRAIESIAAVRGCSAEAALRFCERVERVHPPVSYEAIRQAVSRLKGTRFTEEDVVRMAREIDESAKKVRTSRLKAQNSAILARRSKRWREGRRRGRTRVKRRDVAQGVTRHRARVRHWRG